MVVEDVDTHWPLTPRQKRRLVGMLSKAKVVDFEGNVVIEIGDVLTEESIGKAENILAGDQLYAQMILAEAQPSLSETLSSVHPSTCIAASPESFEEEEVIYESST